jgi:hypothetical protein
VSRDANVQKQSLTLIQYIYWFWYVCCDGATDLSDIFSSLLGGRDLKGTKTAPKNVGIITN